MSKSSLTATLTLTVVFILILNRYLDQQSDPLTLMTDHLQTPVNQDRFHKVRLCQNRVKPLHDQPSPLALQLQKCTQNISPFLLIARGQVHSSGLIPTLEIEGVDLFSTEVTQKCLKALTALPIKPKAFDRISSMSKDIRLDFEIELMRPQDQPLRTQTRFGCTLSLLDATVYPKSTEVNLKDTSPLRTSPYLEGSPIEDDPLYQKLKACDSHLIEANHTSFFQIRPITSNKKQCQTDDPRSTSLTPYDQCICDAFIDKSEDAHLEAFSPGMTVTYIKKDGTEVSKTYQGYSQDPMIPYWFIRKGSAPVLFYKIKRVQKPSF